MLSLPPNIYDARRSSNPNPPKSDHCCLPLALIDHVNRSRSRSTATDSKRSLNNVRQRLLIRRRRSSYDANGNCKKSRSAEELEKETHFLPSIVMKKKRTVSACCSVRVEDYSELHEVVIDLHTSEKESEGKYREMRNYEPMTKWLSDL